MAETLSIRTPKRITLGNANVATQCTLPARARRISIQFITNDGKYAVTGTDAAAIGSDYMTLQSDTLYEIDLVDANPDVARKGVGASFSIYLASATGSTVVEVFVE
jgi:hypothetical protein